MQVLPVPKEIPTWFDHFGLADDIIRGVYCYGFESPSFVQHVAISALMENPQRDMLIYGASGSGEEIFLLFTLLHFFIAPFLFSYTCLFVQKFRAIFFVVGPSIILYRFFLFVIVLVVLYKL